MNPWLSSHLSRFDLRWSKEFCRPEFLFAFPSWISIACNSPGGPFLCGGGGGGGGGCGEEETETFFVVEFVAPKLSVTVKVML